MRSHNITKGPVRHIPIWFDMDMLKAVALGILAGILIGFLFLVSFF